MIAVKTKNISLSCAYVVDVPEEIGITDITSVLDQSLQSFMPASSDQLFVKQERIKNTDNRE